MIQIGLTQIAQSFGYDNISDAQVYEEEVASALLADQLGYDLVSMVEHHFEDYALCPDNFVYLAHIAALTRRIKLMTGAVIVPWNTQPLRVAEKAALLDHLSGGRLIFGLGRGLSRREYGQFGIAMDEARERFDEATPLILEALERGVMPAHQGRFFSQPEAALRPRPKRSFKDRSAQVAMSGDSVIEAARHGLKMMQFAYKPVEVHAQEVATYAEHYRQWHQAAPPVPFFVDFCVCDSNADRAAENADRYVRRYLLSLMHHYEMMGDHFADVKGYEEYGEGARALKDAGMEAIADDYLAGQTWGTPQQILDKIHARRDVLGPYDILLCMRFAGMPYEVLERSLRTFAAEVMPELRALESAETIAA
ncbi:MAG: LLM class flavin-dependent oxidoreductase [Gammaproteobacteria bacterium]|jgi:alkanesulfonate monooxygenase SsuD/methylene tetrahydromethanopterin reductase-like flavin-dependent oxidoreductase (luciferase family)